MLSFDMYPVCDPISIGIMLVIKFFMSLIRWLYFSALILFASRIRCSARIVSSKISTDLFWLLIITMSGRSVDTKRFGGNAPLAVV